MSRAMYMSLIPSVLYPKRECGSEFLILQDVRTYSTCTVQQYVQYLHGTAVRGAIIGGFVSSIFCEIFSNFFV